MRKSWMLVAAVLSGCGGTSPELYDLVVDYFTLPDSCYTSGMQPATVVTTQAPRLMQVQVWDGPDGVAYLEVQGTGSTVDLGAAPNVSISGIFTSPKKGEKGWTFVSDGVEKQTLPANNVITTTTHAELTFDRAGTFKGTAALSSSRNCVGNQCPGANPSCGVSGIVVSGTKLAVQYQRAP
jgi:hypothetical protein